MASTSLTFRCPDEVLEAIDNLGKERYPVANTNIAHGYDRSKALMDIVRAGIAALSEGSIVLPAPAATEARQQPSDVRQELLDSLEQRMAELKVELKAELLGESVA